MSRTKKPYNFGRVFFPTEIKESSEKNPILDTVRLQPLDNHVSNVRRLVEKWKDFPCKDSLPRVVKAAEIHDIGKPQRFYMQVNVDAKGKFKNYIYSFRGHRFLAECDDAWVQSLARGHHDFSVEDITRDAYKLRKEATYAAILNQQPLAYAGELYILEMCDQIEAELACRILDDKKQAESRTFMDYIISPAETGHYLLDPWPFKESEISLNFHYWSKHLSTNEKNCLREICDRNNDSALGKELDSIIKSWWRSQKEDPVIETITATIKPVFQDVPNVASSEQIYRDLAGFLPNPMQAEVFQAINDSEHPAIIVKGPTGAGKTEAILFPALAKGYRLFLPLPARSLLEDQKERIEQYLLKFSNLPKNKGREISMVVDTGYQMYRWVYQNGQDITSTLSINLRRHLYKGDVILTTLDKFLYRYFSFGDQQKSFVFPLRINQSNSHTRSLICFDEAHSYDDIAFTNFQSLVRSLYEAGRSLVLMTATMPDELFKRFDYLDPIDYVDNHVNSQALQTFQEKVSNCSYLNQRSCEWVKTLTRNAEDPTSFQSGFVRIIQDEWKAQPDRRILAVVQTVQDAVEIYKNLKTKIEGAAAAQTKIFLYHGRLAEQERPRIYQEIQQRDKLEAPYVVITTSAIEVGCDLNAETLVSQICPPENLIQRVGRCNRKGNVSDAKVIVVGDCIPEFANSLDDSGWEKYQLTLEKSNVFETEKIRDCISRVEHIDDYRVVEIFSMLHSYVYEADLTCKPTHDRGLVTTRSWTPSATLIYDDGKHGDWTDNLSELPRASVPLDRLFLKKEEGTYINQYSSVDVYERIYDKEATRWKMVPLSWGIAYSKDIFIRIGAVHENVQIDVLEPYHYDSDLGFVDLPGIFIPLKSNIEAKLLYKPSEKQSGSSAIITYIKPLEPHTS